MCGHPVEDEEPGVFVEFERGSVHMGDVFQATGFEVAVSATVVDLLVAMAESDGRVFPRIWGGCRWMVEQVLDDGGRRLIGTVDYPDDAQGPAIVSVSFGDPYAPVPLVEVLGPHIRLHAWHVYAKDADQIKADGRGFTGAGILAIHVD